MITIEQLNKALEEVSWWDTDFILHPDSLEYSDLLECHRYMINELWLSFWIAEFFIAENESETLMYIKSNWNTTIEILWEWIPDFQSLEEYLDFLNEMEEEANLIYNK